MSEGLILIGGGGHAKVVIDCVLRAGGQIAGILDDRLALGSHVLQIPVIGRVRDWAAFTDHEFLIAIGNNAVRKQLTGQLQVKWYTAIHPCAVVSPYAQIGEGSVILAGAIVNPDAVIGAHCIINTGAIIEHDNVLDDFVHISPRAALGGTVRVGSETHIGIGAVVRNNITICAGCTVGAGAVIVKDIAQSGIYVGVPARRRL